ncbi:MAG: hypothetical protein ACK5TE_00475 [Pseudomonadota bacterium]
MISRAWAAGLLSLMLCGCASEWQASRTILPASGVPATTRPADSVGVLARLAVLGVEMNVRATDEQKADPYWLPRIDGARQALQANLVAYLVREKGYEVRAVDGMLPGDEADIRALAAELDVDGLVRVERYIVPPWSTAQAIGNIALVNIPLVRALNAVNLRISILEGRSGQVVWVREMQGEDSELDRRVDLGAALRNLDNAIPPQLRR